MVHFTTASAFVETTLVSFFDRFRGPHEKAACKGGIRVKADAKFPEDREEVDFDMASHGIIVALVHRRQNIILGFAVVVDPLDFCGREVGEAELRFPLALIILQVCS